MGNSSPPLDESDFSIQIGHALKIERKKKKGMKRNKETNKHTYMYHILSHTQATCCTHKQQLHQLRK